MSTLDAPVLRDLASHIVEYPAGSGRTYHRHDDGAVLRLEAKLGGTWHDLTCDAAEIAIQWGDTNGDDLTPYSDAGQCNIILKDLDGRYGPLPPTGFPLFTRWCAVRVWVGHVSDPDDMPVDTTTRYGLPGTYGGTPPAVYGGTARTAQADGISCRFSGWLMSQERTPESDEAVTTWNCGDGMVRLVDQEVRDYDASVPPGTPVADTDWPPGLRENAPGNFRVAQLVSFVHGPAGEPYGIVSSAAPTSRMMQSPGGTVGNLIHKVAEADLSFFWWQPDVSPTDHDTPRDWYGYRTFDWLSQHGLEWPIQCDGVHGYDGTLVSDDRNFYSAVSAAKGFTKRTLWLPQPPWSGFAFDSSVAKVIGSYSFKVQPGEQFSFKSQLDLNCDKASIEYWVRVTGTDLIKLSENSVSRSASGIPTVVTAQSSVVEIGLDTPPDTQVEVQVRARSLSPVLGPGYLATNVWLVLNRNTGTGPKVHVDDPTLADEAEIHEYTREDLLLRQQDDVSTWANWVVNRSKTNRWIMESVSANPDQGSDTWSWGMWHSAWLGDRALLEIPDGGELHTETQWIRGLEFRIADTLTLTMHLETVPAGVGLRTTREVTEAEGSGPSIPIPGGRIIPRYESRAELPGWSYREVGAGLTIDTTGELVWSPSEGNAVYPIRTDDPPFARAEIARGRSGDNDQYDAEVRFYSGGPSHRAYEDVDGNPTPSLSPDWWNVRLGYEGNSGVSITPDNWIDNRDFANNPSHLFEYYSFYFWAYDTWWMEVDAFPPAENEGYPDDLTRYTDGFFEFYSEGGAFWNGSYHDIQAYGPHGNAWFANNYTGAATDEEEDIVARVGAGRPRVYGVADEGLWTQYGMELHATTDSLRWAKAPMDWSVGGGNTPYAMTPRGTLALDIDDDTPEKVQYYRQHGVTTVAFTAGVGSVTVPTLMGASRIPHAIIVGTTVAGPMVAQVASDSDSLTFYLSTVTTGSLDVAWVVEHTAFVYDTSPPFIQGMFGSDFFNQVNTVAVGTGTAPLNVDGYRYQDGCVLLADDGSVFAGPFTPTIWGTDWPNQTRIVIDVSRAHPVGHVERYRILNPDGQTSQWVPVEWISASTATLRAAEPSEPPQDRTNRGAAHRRREERRAQRASRTP